MAIQAQSRSLQIGRVGGYAELLVRGFEGSEQGVSYAVGNTRSDEYLTRTGWKIDREWLAPDESSRLSDGTLRVVIGPDVVRHVPDIGNYKLELRDAASGAISATVVRWQVDPPHDGDLDVYARDLRGRAAPPPSAPVREAPVREAPVAPAEPPRPVAVAPPVPPVVPVAVEPPPRETVRIEPAPAQPAAAAPQRKTPWIWIGGGGAVAALALLAFWILRPGAEPQVGTGSPTPNSAEASADGTRRPCKQDGYSWAAWVRDDVTPEEAQGCVAKWAEMNCEGAEFAAEYIGYKVRTADAAFQAGEFFDPPEKTDECGANPERARFWLDVAVKRAQASNDADALKRAQERLAALAGR